jgi:hypothetical protein
MVTMNPGWSNRKRHLGLEFVIWSRGSTWFWLLNESHTKGGVIGATADEARAISEACLAIEERELQW